MRFVRSGKGRRRCRDFTISTTTNEEVSSSHMMNVLMTEVHKTSEDSALRTCSLKKQQQYGPGSGREQHVKCFWIARFGCERRASCGTLRPISEQAHYCSCCCCFRFRERRSWLLSGGLAGKQRGEAETYWCEKAERQGMSCSYWCPEVGGYCC